jgi:effector-binding domain-containing protein
MGQTTTPGDGAKAPAGVTVSEMRVQTLKGFTFMHLKQTTTVKGMVDHLGKDVKGLSAAMTANHIERHGPLVIVMHGVTADPDRAFEIEAGFEVEAGAAAPAGYAVAELPPSKLAVVLYGGPLMGVGEAYRRTFAGLPAAGLTATGNMREYILYNEGVDSPNSVAMAAVEVK